MTTTTAPTELPADLRDVRRKLEQLAATGRIDDLIELVVEPLARMGASNNSLATRLGNALRELYGRRSQKIDHETLTNLLKSLGKDVPVSAAEAAEPPSTEPEKGNVPQPPEPPKPPRSGAGRSPLPAILPRKSRKVRVPAEERACASCENERGCIGYRTSEVLEFKPAEFWIIEEQREKLVCPRCPEQGGPRRRATR